MSNNLQSEIDYLKTLAVDGDRGPLQFGSVLFWTGIIFGGASVMQYLFLAQIINLVNPWFLAFMWLGAGFLFSLVIILSIKKNFRKSAANRASGSVWSAIGWAIFAFFISLFAFGLRLQESEQLLALAAPTVLILYGIGWWVSASMSSQGWLKAVSLGCFVTAPILAFMGGMPEQLLVYAACLILFATLPGLRLMQLAKAG